MLHGALGASPVFDSLIPHLEEYYELIIPDLRWHGQRTEASDFEMIDLVHDLEQILQSIGEAVYVFGYSMGGYTALVLALQSPDLFKGIMCLGTKLSWEPEQANVEVKQLNPEKIAEKVPHFADHLAALHGTGWKQLCRQTAQMMIGLGKKPLLSPEKAKTIDIPVRITLGDRDHMVSIEESHAFYKSLPNGTFQVFPDCRHPLEKTDHAYLAASIHYFTKTTYQYYKPK